MRLDSRGQIESEGETEYCSPEIEASADTTTAHHCEFIDSSWGGEEIIGRSLSYSGSVLARCCSVQFPSMTTIASAYTSEGFVVGADGMQVSGKTGETLTDNLQKIFIIDHPKVRGVHAWVGAMRLFSSVGSDFDFSAETQKIIKGLATTEFARLSDFVTCIGKELYGKLAAGRKSLDAAILQKNSVAGGLFVAYINKRAERVHLVFPHENGLLSPPFLQEVSEAPKDFFRVGGSDRVWNDLGQVSPPSSQAEAVDLVRKYIQLCVDKSEEYPECKGTGGKIRIAAVTPDTVEWINLPHQPPTPTAPQTPDAPKQGSPGNDSV